MSETCTNLENPVPYSPSLYVTFTTNGNIFDLSGKVPFKIYANVSRRWGQFMRYPDAHKLPVDILANGTLFDISSAIKKGAITLTEIDGEYSEAQKRDQSKQVLSKELFINTVNGSISEPLQIIRLRSGLRITPIDPQCIECLFESSISATFKDNKTYVLNYSSEAEQRSWNGGITWWRLVSEPPLLPDLSLPSDEPQVKIRKSRLPMFKAMSDPPRPPRIEYELDFTPAELSFSNLDVIRVGVEFRLLEAARYTVMSIRRNTGPGPNTTALGSSGIGSFSFDIVDINTCEILSTVPIYGNGLFSPGLSPYAFHKEQLRELEPGVTYTGQSEVILNRNEDKLAAFLRYFRIKDMSILQGRRLGVQLRPVETFWSRERIDELFEHEQAPKPDCWYIPLTIESSAIAEFRIV